MLFYPERPILRDSCRAHCVMSHSESWDADLGGKTLEEDGEVNVEEWAGEKAETAERRLSEASPSLENSSPRFSSCL